MQTKRIKSMPQVHILTQKADMKFIPKIYDAPSDTRSSVNQSSISSKLKSFLRFSKSSDVHSVKNDSQISIASSENSANGQSAIQSSKISQYDPPTLKFVERITPQFILIGNEHQLDLINVSNISDNNFVDTEFYWSLQFQGKIQSIAVDTKKMNVLAVIVDKTLKIYKYDYKKIPKQPFHVFKEVTLQEKPFCMTMARDGNICIFYKYKYQIYSVTDQIRKRRDKRHQVFDMGPPENFQILTVPQPYQNILNIFFAQKLENEKIFALWSVQLEFQALQIKHSDPRKIYEIKSQFKQTLTLSNYARDIFIMNLKNEINAVKPGYVLDSANIRMNKGEQFLNYMGNDILLHTSKKMIQVYNFSLNTQVKPSRIQIKAKDSIKIYDDLKNYEFFKILPVFNNQIVIIFQIQKNKNKNRNGQVNYCLYLTKGITKQQKINILFPKYSWDFKPGSDDLNERCDMARKMGLSIKQIYLELWNRTKKCEQEDFQILISTNDYTTIKNQILRKLKKASMPFKQIWKIQQQCFLMLQSRIFGAECTQQSIMEYIACHFFLRKLQMFKDEELLNREIKSIQSPLKSTIKISQIENQEDKVIKMTIRQYQNLKSMEIKSELLNLIGIFCDQKKQGAIKKIRFLLRSFKFVFRTIYFDLLEEIIIKSKEKLYQLIVAIPQLLPYQSIDSFQQINYPINFFDGVWPAINSRQWKQSLYVDSITTIDNKQIVLQKVIKSLSFRRNYLSQHDMVTMSKKDIQANARKIKSEQIFYFFIAKMFEHVKLQPEKDKSWREREERQIKQKQIKNVQQKVIKFIEQNYEMMPKGIKRKVFLIERLYNYMRNHEKKILPQINGRLCTLTQFLKFKDQEFIRHCFIQQRSIKGLILKQIKPKYEEVCGNEGKSLFNNALLNYFISDLSEVSDLKYILNRINNQKKQFHFQNQEMYKILVQALERKLKIGTGNDIPLQQVLIYIQNIPFKEEEQSNGENNSKAMQELQLVHSVKEQVALLQAARINMSVYDILHKQDQVITKLVIYLLSEQFILTPQEKQQLQKYENCSSEIYESKLQAIRTYRYIALLEDLSQQIYGKNNSKRIFFIYLTKLCQKASMIKHACHLLQDEFLSECYDSSMAENLVQYLYKFKMSQDKVMIHNQYYVSQLLKLISPKCITRIYLECQMRYAKLFSRDDQQYEYPINQNAYTIIDLKNELLGLPIDFLLKLNLQELYQIIHKIQEIYLDSISQDDQEAQFEFSVSNFITLHQIYQIVIIQLLHARKLKQVLPFIRKILEQQISDPTYNIIYPILYIIEISSEINDQNKKALISSISYYFCDAWRLLQIHQNLINVPRNPRQIKSYLDFKLFEGKQKSKGYNQDNSVFNHDYLENIESKAEEQLFMQRLNEATKHMQQSKEEFKDAKYAAIMTMLCNSPYALAKLITCSERINVSAIRCFLSYAIRQDVFKSQAILELGRRIFLILLQSQKNKEAIEQIIEKFCNYDLLQDQIDVQFTISNNNEEQQFLRIWWRSSEAFRKKKQKVVRDNQNNLKVNQESKQEKSQRIKKSLGSKSNHGDQPNEYPFVNVDNDNQIEDIIDIRESIGIRKNRGLFKFDRDGQINRALGDKKKKGLFRSSNEESNQRSSGQLSMSIRGPKFSSDGKNIYQSVAVSDLKKRSSFQDKKQEIDLTQSHKIFESLQSNSLQPKRNQQISDNQKPRSWISNSRQLSSEQFEQNSQQEISNNYVVQIKQVKDEESSELIQEDNPQKVSQILVQNQEENQSPEQLAKQFIQLNLTQLEKSQAFDLSSLQRFEQNASLLRKIAVQIYRFKPIQIKTITIFSLLIELSKKFPQTEISEESLQLLINATQEQQKIIIDIPFNQLLPAEQVLTNFSTKKDIFPAVSHRLSLFTDSENLYKVCLFAKRAFGNPQFQSEISWNFILNLCEKYDSLEQQEAQMLLQKIEQILSKVKLSIWNSRFDRFVAKVLPSKQLNKLLKIFCDYLINAVPRSEAKIFLEKVANIIHNQQVANALKQME